MPDIWDQAEKSMSVWDQAESKEPTVWERTKSVAKGTLANMAAGVNEANQGVLTDMDKGAVKVADATGFKSGGGFKAGAEEAKLSAEDWKRKALEAGQDPESIPGQVYRAVGGAPMGVAHFVGGVGLAALQGLAEDGVTGAIKKGAERFAVGKIFHAIGDSSMDLLGKTATMTAVMTGQAAAEPGATPKSIATGALTGALLSMQGGNGRQDVVRQRLIKAGVDPKVAADLSSRLPDKLSKADLENPTWDYYPGAIKDKDLLADPEYAGAKTDSTARPQAVSGPIRDSENAPRMEFNKETPGSIEGRGSPESTSSVAREGVEVLEPRQDTRLYDNQEVTPSATDMSTIRPDPMGERNQEQVPDRTRQGVSLENPQQTADLDAQVQQHNQEVAQREQQKVQSIAEQQKATADAVKYIGNRVERTFTTPQGDINVKWKLNKGQVEVTTTTPEINGKSKESKVMTLPELAEHLKSLDKVPQDKYLGVEATNEPNAQKASQVDESGQKDVKPAVSKSEVAPVSGKSKVEKTVEAVKAELEKEKSKPEPKKTDKTITLNGEEVNLQDVNKGKRAQKIKDLEVKVEQAAEREKLKEKSNGVSSKSDRKAETVPSDKGASSVGQVKAGDKAVDKPDSPKEQGVSSGHDIDWQGLHDIMTAPVNNYSQKVKGVAGPATDSTFTKTFSQIYPSLFDFSDPNRPQASFNKGDIQATVKNLAKGKTVDDLVPIQREIARRIIEDEQNMREMAEAEKNVREEAKGEISDEELDALFSDTWGDEKPAEPKFEKVSTSGEEQSVIPGAQRDFNKPAEKKGGKAVDTSALMDGFTNEESVQPDMFKEADKKGAANEKDNGQGRPDGAEVKAQPEGRSGGNEAEAQRSSDAEHEGSPRKDLLSEVGEKSPAEPPDPKLLHAGIHVPEAIKAIRQLPLIKETIDGIQMFLNPGSLQSPESRKAMGTLKGEKSKIENRLGVLGDKAMDGRTWKQKAEDLWNGTQTLSKQVGQLGKTASIEALDNIRAGNFDKLPESAKKVFAIGQEFDTWFSGSIRTIFPDFPLRENHGMLTVAYKDLGDTEAFPYVSASLEGTKGFTKKYSGDSVSDVMAKTGKDIAEWNLWKVLQGSLSDHTKFLRTAVYMRDGIDSGRLTYIPKGQEVDFKNLKEIPDKVAKVMKPFLNAEENGPAFFAKSFNVLNEAGEIVKQFPTSELAKKYAIDNELMRENSKGEMVPNVDVKMGAAQFAEAGKWYGPKAEMVELERYLARDKIRQIPFFKALLEVKGLVTSTELYGGFHFSTISKEGVANRVANALTLGTAHKWEDAAKVLHPKNGYGAMNLWKECLADPKGFADSPQAQGVLKQMGFTSEKWKAYQYLLYKNGFKIEDNADHSSWLGEAIDTSDFAPVKAIRLAKDAAMLPLDYLFKEFVPSRKTISAMRSLDTYAKTYADRLQSGEVTIEELAKRTAVHHDNVFGQLNYDSLGLDKNFKTIMQIALRAPGWQLGNIRSVVNAFRFQGAEFSRSAKTLEAGKFEPPVLTPEMSWMLSTLAVHMAEAGIISYGMAALTGNDELKPKEFTDWLYPKVSMVTKVMPPGYVKDWASIVYGLQTAPVDFMTKFVTSKLAGQWSMLEEWRKNRDYYNTQVYSPDDSLPQQAYDTAKHFIPKPIMVKSAGAEKKAGDTHPVEKILSVLGYNKVPGWVEQSAAVSKAISFTGERYPKTHEEKEHSDLIRKLSGQYMNDPKTAAESISEALKGGKLGKRDLATIKNHITQPPLERMFKQLSSEQAIDVWKVATPEEQKQLMKPMSQKLRGLANSSPEDRARIFEKWNKIKGGGK